MSDNENDWGNKKMLYYSKNKQDNDDDSDFVEEEKEAIRIQQKKLEKIKKSQLLEEDSDEEDKEKEKESKIVDVDRDEDNKVLPLNEEEIKNDISKVADYIDSIDEIKQTTDIFDSQKDFFNIPLTTNYLELNKKALLSLSACLLFSSLCKLNNKMTSHHPSIKTIAMLNYLIEKSNDSTEEIKSKLNKLMDLLKAKTIKDAQEIKKEKKMLKKKTKRDANENDFVSRQLKDFENMKKQKSEAEIQRLEKLKKEIDMKNELGVRRVNKEVLKARGIYRKRPQYKGNARLTNREKYYKKEKERNKAVKKYVGKPDVYMGEATGIRRDYVRSTKLTV